MSEQFKQAIQDGQAVLGIELGSTRIKVVLINQQHRILASGEEAWENQLENGVWTYDIQQVWPKLQTAYQRMKEEVHRVYGLRLTKLSSIGISAMMHGYLAFDEKGELLTPFRTWRNTMTQTAAAELSGLFSFNIPQRWSIAHLYQAMLNGEAHLPRLRFLTTLAGHVHERLTGKKVLGVGDASGMFPLDENGQYHPEMVLKFERLAKGKGHEINLSNLLPQPLSAGQQAGSLTSAGARLLDPTGDLMEGIPLCPPEADAATGMTATNAVAPRTGNISAGTSIFAMIVLEKALRNMHPEIDLVATPDGSPVAMVHCNNCTTDLNLWVEVFSQFLTAAQVPLDKGRIYAAFFDAALKGDRDAGGLVSIGYHSGEHITEFSEGRPLLTFRPEANMGFANLARAILFASLATLRIGMDILDGENVRLSRLMGHGGLYKTGTAGQRFTAAALQAPVTVLKTADLGGAWGIAILAGYLVWGKDGESLPQYLDQRVFASMEGTTLPPDPEDVAGFAAFMARFRQALLVERAAVDSI